jgi:alkanesulfonate monooxygenase SsuD/methylene tetrahydromethanopterin reductase-like flavin-dependent oxidoreductase (luciferase family)
VPLLGLNLPIVAGGDAAPGATARRAEALGFDFVSLNDHPEGAPTHEAWTLLTWIAAKTDRIKVATRVLGLPYRSPAMVAKMAATLDALAPGRVILGLGGGSGDDEMRAFGVPVPAPGEKMDRLEEAVLLIRGLWSEREFSFSGQHYRSERATIAPRPRSLPIWLGTFGPRGLAITGALADGWIPSLGHASRASLPVMRRLVLEAAERAGRDPAAITCVLNVTVHIGSWCDDPDVLSGAPSQVADGIDDLLSLGFDGLNIVLVGDKMVEQTRILATEVLGLPASGGDG